MVHYGLTPRWSERSIGEHNNKVQPQVRGDESTPAASGACCVSVVILTMRASYNHFRYRASGLD